MADKVRITWKVSGINRQKTHKNTIKALGFTKLNQTREHELTPQIQGMLRQVGYLCKVEKIS
jgi:large subunit ribosomal protein L30